MNDRLLQIKKELKNKRKYAKNNTPKRGTSININKYISKFLLTVILLLITLITLKSNNGLKTAFYKQIFDSNISFATINKLYQNYFGTPIPFENLFKNNAETVFNEELNYSETSKYKDGVKLTVEKNYLVPVVESGIVIFVGEKEGYGNTVIIQQTNGIDLWYSNVGKLDIKLYDFVEKGSLLGETNGTDLYLVYIKDGKVLDYNEYI